MARLRSLGLGVVALWSVSAFVGCAPAAAPPPTAPAKAQVAAEDIVPPQGFDKSGGLLTTSLAAACEGLVADSAANALYAKGCNANDAVACLKLGGRLMCGSGVEKSPKVAVELFEKACKLNDADGCFAFGASLLEGNVVPSDPGRAYRMLHGACDRGSARVCGALGAMLLATAPESEHAHAAQLLDKGCAAKDPQSCTNLAVIYLNGLAGRTKDVKRGFALSKQACEDGNPGACGNLGVMYVTATGVDADPKLGVELLNKACEGSDTGACVQLAQCVANGVGTDKNTSRAAGLLRKACDRGHGGACRMLADLSLTTNVSPPLSSTSGAVLF